jgi:hypothetical protein
VNAAAPQLSLELLEDAIALAHPDRHPPERAARAGRVTAELLALRAYIKPKCDEMVVGDREFHIPAMARSITSSRLVTASPCFLLSMEINSQRHGSKIQLFDALSETNPSSGEIQVFGTGPRWLGIHHRTAIFAKISGEMDVTFFFTRAN